MYRYAFALAVGCYMFGAQAHAGPGAAYGARDPRACNGYAGPLNQQLAQTLFTCNEEDVRERGSGNVLELVTNVSLTLYQPRRFSMASDRFENIVTTAPVYPISGRYSQYDCSSLAGGNYAAGANCTHYDIVNAVGECYMTSTYGWLCTMTGDQVNYQNAVAPPSGG